MNDYKIIDGKRTCVQCGRTRKVVSRADLDERDYNAWVRRELQLSPFFYCCKPPKEPR